MKKMYRHKVSLCVAYTNGMIMAHRKKSVSPIGAFSLAFSGNLPL
jgi:hypothetical protein